MIKTRQWNFTNIIISNSMQYNLYSFHYFCIKQSINKLFMSYAFNNTFIDSFCFFLTYWSTTLTKEYVFNCNPTNPLIIFPLNFSFLLPITFLLTGSKTLNLADNHSNQTNFYPHKNLHKHYLFQFHKLNFLCL